MKRRTKARHRLTWDFVYIIVGVFIAIVLSESGLLDRILGVLGGLVSSSFISGIFFTSAFTLAPASIAFAHLAPHGSMHTIALWGALGAMFGDLILFLFIRDRFAADLINSLKPSTAKHVLNSFHLGFLKWLSPILGAAIIASPLPDELGLVLLGISKTKIILLLPISFLMNMLGVYTILLFAQSF